MENNSSNLYSLSRNKYNINLLETIEHKELFQNIGNNLANISNTNSPKRNYNIQNNNYQSENIINNINKQKSLLNNIKNSSKSFNNIMKNKLDNIQEVFYKNSTNQPQRFLTQNNSGKINININNAKSVSTSLNKRITENKALLDHNLNLSNFNYQRINNNNNNLISEEIDHLSPSRNEKSQLQNYTYFNKSNKKEITNNSKYSYNSNNNKNLDVYNRLYNQSYYKKKNIDNIIAPEENDCTFNPNLLSNIKEKKTNHEEINNFIKRQEKFNKYITQKKINLKQDLYKKESKKCTFTPNTSCTSGSKYSIKLEAQRQDESKLDKTNRMVYEQIKKMEVKNNNLFLLYNNKYSFIPLINKKRNIKKLQNCHNVTKFKKRNIDTIKKENEVKNNPKYINHQYDNIKSNYKNDKELMLRIKEENRKRKKRIDNIRKEHENLQFEGYTFKPEINRNNLSYMNNINLNINNTFYNKNLEREMSYTHNYNKKRNKQNKLNRSYSCYNKNNLYINSNINYNNFNNSKEHICYNNTEYENNIYNNNDYNNYNINYTYCNSNFGLKNDINPNYSDYYNEYNKYNNRMGEYYESKPQFNNIGRRSLSVGYNRRNVNHMYTTPKSNKIYKSRAMNNLKREDQENFLLIHKLLYDK